MLTVQSFIYKIYIVCSRLNSSFLTNEPSIQIRKLHETNHVRSFHNWSIKHNIELIARRYFFESFPEQSRSYTKILYSFKLMASEDRTVCNLFAKELIETAYGVCSYKLNMIINKKVQGRLRKEKQILNTITVRNLLYLNITRFFSFNANILISANTNGFTTFLYKTAAACYFQLP